MEFPKPKSHEKFNIAGNKSQDLDELKDMKLVRLKRQYTKHMQTRYYRAPEVILLNQQKASLFAMDVWSVGCIMAELFDMMQVNCPDYHHRSVLFPGRSSFPLSGRQGDPNDQL